MVPREIHLNISKVDLDLLKIMVKNSQWGIHYSGNLQGFVIIFLGGLPDQQLQVDPSQKSHGEFFCNMT